MYSILWTCSLSTLGVPDIQFRNATGLGVDVIGPTEQGGHALYEPDAAGNVEGCVPVSVADQGVGVGLQQVLHYLLLPR